jgi:putative membrane protein
MKRIRDRLNWKLLLMSLVANMLAISLAVALLPGLNVQIMRLSFIILLAIALGLLNTFIKPILQVITIRLFFITYGLILIVTNTIMLLLLDWLFPSLYVSGLLTAILGGVLISLFSDFFDYLFGVTPPIGYQQAIEEQERAHERA